ncbi:hypothetical protein FD755_000895 [Muntiacus reevesi]|uniref:Uncharacterized protein n=1 Tax=Muntiacus reevesi TaxID=9886 RepID=A0A5J5N2R7_MUNRE|nr:hypothetical protein FD755_000895 [Muntiacus reevesi]
MYEQSQLYEESTDVQTDLIHGKTDPQMEQEEETQPTAEQERYWGFANWSKSGEQPGQIASPGFEKKEQSSGADYRISAALEEANKMFLRTSRAREAALDGRFQMHYE